MQYEFEKVVDPDNSKLAEMGLQGWHCIGVMQERLVTAGWEQKATQEMAKQGFYTTPLYETKTVFYMEREKLAP